MTAPIILANKNNIEAVHKAIDPSRGDKPLNEEEKDAIANSTRGGAKLVALAGAIFNNKDDKKGYADTYQQALLDATGGKMASRFPDTSNTRFQSHGKAAEVILKYLGFHRTFLVDAKYQKKRPGWTNIEKNVHSGLEDPPTLTELAVMVLYSQCITEPYMKAVRGPGTESTNLLTLGPLHKHVKEHCTNIIANPELLFSPNGELATLDSEAWSNQDAVNAVLELVPTLPHLQHLAVAFFEGALTTWIRFSAEFAPGGLIDQATAEQRELAWMPSTNDTNEGALGAYRVFIRETPRVTQLNVHHVANMSPSVY